MKKILFSLALVLGLSMILMVSGCEDSQVFPDITTTTTIPQVATPTFTVAAGSYDTSSLTVTIECSTPGANIYYSMDGSSVSAATAKASAVSPVTVILTSSKTLNAIAIADGYNTSAIATAQYDLYWWSALGSTPPDDAVIALAMDNGGNLYAGGNFGSVGGNNDCNFIAKWNGSSWEALDQGAVNSVVALAFDGSGNLFVGGAFTGIYNIASAYMIAKWDGSVWSTVGNSLDNFVLSLNYDTNSGNIYATGLFTKEAYASTVLNRMAKWNGVSWESLGNGVLSNVVYDLAIDNSGNIYAGGIFTTIEGIANTSFIAKWTGVTWEALGSGLDSLAGLTSLAIDNSGDLYAAGSFTTAGGVASANIARWDGSNWNALNSGTNDTVWTISIDGSGNLYAGGAFTTAGGTTVNRIAKWNGTTWSSIGNGLTGGNVRAIIFDDSGNIYVGGAFTDAGGIAEADYIAKWGKI